jgi:mannose-6-phosphate isomerase-like protein (cupin superfamily)
MKRHFHKHDRCGFLSLPVDGEVGRHIDEGTYYVTRDRYHLSILGRYRYFVGDEYVDVEPGTLLWFNNKELHGTKNIGNCTRITFVFDVPHSKNNP